MSAYRSSVADIVCTGKWVGGAGVADILLRIGADSSAWGTNTDIMTIIDSSADYIRRVAANAAGIARFIPVAKVGIGAGSAVAFVGA